MSGPWQERLLAPVSSAAIALALYGARAESWGPLPVSLVMVPWVVLGLQEVQRWSRARGGTEPARVGGEILLVAGLVVLGLVHETLALEFSDRLVVVGLATVLGWRTIAIALSLPMPPAGRHHFRDSWPFLALPLMVYLALLPWSTASRPPDGDEPWYLLLTHSLAWDHDIDLADNYRDADSLAFMPRRIEPQPGDPTGPNGEQYSRHNVLLPLVLAPAYRLAGLHGALAMMALLSAATAWQFLLFAQGLFPGHERGARLAWTILAFAPPLPIYSYQVWVEIPAALLTIVALRSLQQPERGDERPAARLRPAFVVALVLLPLLKLRFILVAGGLLALALVRLRPSRRWVAGACVAAAVATLALLAVNQIAFGDPLKGRSWEVLEIYAKPPRDFLVGSIGLFFDSSFGLFAASPIWILALPALGLALGSRRRLLGDGLLVATAYLAFVVADPAWYGGWCPPFRYPMVFLPLLAALLVPLLEPRPRSGGRFLLWALASATAALALLWIAVPAWTYNHALGRSHLLDHLSRIAGADVSRFFPSGLRPRLATWLWPPLLALGSWLAWRIDLRPLRRAAPLGVLLTLLAGPAVLATAQRLPTHVLELEDPVGRRGGGALFPDLWEPTRTAYPGSWRLYEGEAISQYVVAGSDRLDLEVTLLFWERSTGTAIEVLADGKVVATTPLANPWEWQNLAIPGVDWPAGATRLGFRLRPGESANGDASSVMLDRARLRWR